jgi:hypothetical protein
MKLVTSRDVINFVKEHVIHRFGIPQTITTDGGSVFISDEFKKFAADTGIKLVRSSLWQNHLKYASPFLKAPTCFKRFNPLACRVTSLQTTDTHDQIKLPHTKVSPEIQSPSYFTS